MYQLELIISCIRESKMSSLSILIRSQDLASLRRHFGDKIQIGSVK